MILTTDMSKSEKTVQEKEDIIKSNNRNLENLKRELAINTLNKTSDENIELYMMQLCQCLFYENYLIKDRKSVV